MLAASQKQLKDANAQPERSLTTLSLRRLYSFWLAVMFRHFGKPKN